MATMFGVDATTLNEPRRAGAEPLAPVAERVVDPGYGGYINVAGGVAASAASFFNQKKKDTPEWMGVRNEFQERLARLSEAANQATDGISRNRYMTQARSLYNQYMANYSHYGADFSKSISEAYGYNKTGSGLDEVEDVRKREVENNQKLIQNLANEGVVPAFGSLTPEQETAALSMAHNFNLMKRQNEELLAEEDRTIKRNAEGRAQVSHAFTTSQQTRQLQSQGQLSTTLSASVDLLVANTDAVKARVDSGEISFTDGLFALKSSMMSQRKLGNVALQGDDQTLSTYNSFMDNYMAITEKYLDPSTRTKDVEDEYQRLINIEKLNLARKPAGAQAIVLSDLLGKDVMANLNTSRFLNSIGNDLDAAYRSNTVPSILSGDTGAQQATMRSVQEQVQKAKNNQLPAGNKAMEQAGQFSNSVLNSIGSMNYDDPKSLAYVNDFMASDSFAEMVKQGRISPALAAKAREPFIENYAKGLGKSVDSFLYNVIGEATYTDGQRDMTKTPTRVQLLRFEPNSDGTFKVLESRDPTYTFTMSPYHAASIRSQAEKQASDISKTVRSYAHIQGHTNYEQAWNEIRHILVPDQYPTPNRVKEAMADGWDGVGFFGNSSSWKRKDGGTDK